MEIIKIAALALMAVILIVLVKNYKSEFAVPVTIGCSIIILYFIIDSIKYALLYITHLYNNLEYGKAYLPVIVKILAISYITEFTSQLCKDSGESSIASKVELAGKVIIFCVAVPVFVSIIDIIEKLL